MARRQSNPKAEAPEVETVEESTATEEQAPTESTTEVEAEVEDKHEDKPLDLSGFQAAVAEALTEADTTTGDIAPAGLESVNKVYRELEGIKAKNAARTWIDEQMRLAISEKKDIVLAKSYVMLKDNLSAGSGHSGPRTPADPTQAFVQRVVALNLAYTEVVANVPEGVNEDWSEKVGALTAELAPQVEEYRNWLHSNEEDKGDAPEVSPVVRQAFKLATGRSSGGGTPRTFTGTRRDIEKHLVQVFDSLEPGAFLTVNEIAKAASAEYGDDRPSAGAVSARLFPKGKPAFESHGVKAVAEEGKSRGAVKL